MCCITCEIAENVTDKQQSQPVELEKITVQGVTAQILSYLDSESVLERNIHRLT